MMNKIHKNWRNFKEAEAEILNEGKVRIHYLDKFAKVVTEAYKARPDWEKKIIPHYKNLLEAVNMAYNNLHKKHVVFRAVDNYSTIGYNSAQGMRDRVEETDVLLVNGENDSHPIFNKDAKARFDAIYHYYMYVVKEVSFNLEQQMNFYPSLLEFLNGKGAPALFNEVVAPICHQIHEGEKIEKRKVCYLHGFDFNNLGMIREDEYQQNFRNN